MKSTRRRGATAVMVAVVTPVLIAFAALSVDVGVMYNAKTDMQRAADAAALAAAGQLGVMLEGDPLVAARSMAKDFVAKNLVLNKSCKIDNSDITFGQAVVNNSGTGYDFIPTNITPNAVEVRIRHTEGSPNGALPLYFAAIFGIKHTDVTASATAMVIPRDIAVVADLSRSHNFDSSLHNYRATEINLYDVWDNLPGGIDDVDGSTWGNVDPSTLTESQLEQMAGPAWGLFRDLGFGTKTLGASYDPDRDPGLIKLQSGQNWNTSVLTQALARQGYNSSEVQAIASSRSEARNGYADRVAVALGLAVWNSGLRNGLWQSTGGSRGDGDTTIESREITWVESFGDRSVSESAQIWKDYINNYVSSSRSSMAGANRDFQYQYGVKTFVDYLMVNRASHDQTPELAQTPHQPMQAVKDAVSHLGETIAELQGIDHLSLEVYGTRGRHELDLTTDYESIVNRLNGMQAGYYDSSTNMGAGILRGVEQLTGMQARQVAQKVMIVLTDGCANIGSEYATRMDEDGGREYALNMAEYASAQGIKIFAVSVGSGADTDLMARVAEIGNGEHFHAEGSIEQYSDELDRIFRHLGGVRPVALIK